jgi:hypothetical protein
MNKEERMKGAGRFLIVGVLCFAALAVLAGGGGAADPAALAQSKCAACHNLERVCKNLGVKDAAAWKETVDRMVAKGPKVTAEEGKEITPYLAGLKAGAKPICP